MSDPNVVETLPVLPLKNTVLFPYLLLPLAVDRPSSVAAVEAALAREDKELVVVAQRNGSADAQLQNDLYSIGTKAVIKKKVTQDNGGLEVILLGIERSVIIKLEQAESHLQGRVKPLPLLEQKTAEVEALHRELLEMAGKALGLTEPKAFKEIERLLGESKDPFRLVYVLASMFNMEVEREQSLLEAETSLDALRLMHSHLSYELQVLELRSKIASEAQSEMSRQQREYLLRQQMRAIQQELGSKNPEDAEAELIRERLQQADLPDEVRKEAEREVSRLERLPAGAPDHSVARTYLELLLELPWKTSVEGSLNIPSARHVLDEDHYDLKEVKERILEYLGVLKLNPGAKSPILCFVGAPGVGKTSLGQSIARAVGRKFERLSLGGMHDEAELRGHRRTYIGAMPGRIIQAVRRAGVNNPVLMLDEIDKVGRDFRGDPAAALLEILDPEQNRTFRDNYLDLPFDLSRIFFVTTANTVDTIPQPLLDRMEVLRLPGYSEEEKIEIAQRYLIPRQLQDTGLSDSQVSITRDALLWMISRYTREAGVRQLERTIGRVARKIALRHAEGRTEPVEAVPEDLTDYLGPHRFMPEQTRQVLPFGVATGLAWTETGGDVLYVEATLLPGSRGLTLTGQLGAVMQESAKAAQSYIWSHAESLGIDPALFRRHSVHVHVPAGATPKDGPSAGVTLATAFASLYSKIPVRANTAMTGEITLTGLVLPVGGIKEKVLAAHRAHIQRVILPKDNEKDLRELPNTVHREIQFVFAERIEDVLVAAIPELNELLAVARAS